MDRDCWIFLVKMRESLSELDSQVRHPVLEPPDVAGQEHYSENDHDSGIQVHKGPLVLLEELQRTQEQIDKHTKHEKRHCQTQGIGPQKFHPVDCRSLRSGKKENGTQSWSGARDPASSKAQSHQKTPEISRRFIVEMVAALYAKQFQMKYPNCGQGKYDNDHASCDPDPFPILEKIWPT